MSLAAPNRVRIVAERGGDVASQSLGLTYQSGHRLNVGNVDSLGEFTQRLLKRTGLGVPPDNGQLTRQIGVRRADFAANVFQRPGQRQAARHRHGEHVECIGQRILDTLDAVRRLNLQNEPGKTEQHEANDQTDDDDASPRLTARFHDGREGGEDEQ